LQENAKVNAILCEEESLENKKNIFKVLKRFNVLFCIHADAQPT
jgi:hypothetical protein